LRNELIKKRMPFIEEEDFTEMPVEIHEFTQKNSFIQKYGYPVLVNPYGVFIKFKDAMEMLNKTR